MHGISSPYQAPLLYLLVIFSPKLKSYKEAIVAEEAYLKEALFVGCTIDRIVNLKHARQRTLHDYFTH